MSITDKIAALIEALRRDSFDSMCPAERRHLARVCRYIADKADTQHSPKMSIVLQTRAFLNVLDGKDFAKLSADERGRFADLCRHVAKVAESVPPPKSGVLADVARNGVHGE